MKAFDLPARLARYGFGFQGATAVFIPPWLNSWLNPDPYYQIGDTPPNILLHLFTASTIIFIFSVCSLTGSAIWLWPLDGWSTIDSRTCPVIIPCQKPCKVEADADIAGIGVRLATYIQTIFNVVILGFSSRADRTSSIFANLVLTSLAALITLVSLSFKGQLSLHHSTIATSLLAMTILPIWVVTRRRTHSPGLFLAQELRMLAYFGIRFWTFLKMPCLGSDPQCNLCTQGSLFGRTFDVVGSSNRTFRFWIDFMTFLFWMQDHYWFFGCAHLLQAIPACLSEEKKSAWVDYINSYYNHRSDWKRHRMNTDARMALHTIYIRVHEWLDNNDPVSKDIEDVKECLQHPPHACTRKQRVLVAILTAMHNSRCQKTILSLAWAIVLIYDVEKSVRLNLDDSRDEWGYGQIFAMTLTVPSITGLAKLLLNKP